MFHKPGSIQILSYLSDVSSFVFPYLSFSVLRYTVAKCFHLDIFQGAKQRKTTQHKAHNNVSNKPPHLGSEIHYFNGFVKISTPFKRHNADRVSFGGLDLCISTSFVSLCFKTNISNIILSMKLRCVLRRSVFRILR